MKFNKIILLTLLCTAQVTIAQNYKFGKVSKEELEEKMHPLETEAVAAILYRELKTNFDYSESDGFYTITDVVERVKIYKKEGFDWGTKTVGLYLGDGGKKEVLTGLKAYTYSLGTDGKIVEDKLKNDGIFDEKANKNRDLKKFTMPSLTEGCIIEYKYTVKSPFVYSIDEYRLQEEIPVKMVYIRFATPEYLNYKTHQKGWLPIKIDLDNRDRKINYRYTQSGALSGGGADKSVATVMEFKEEISEVTMKSVPALKEEPYSSDIDNYASSLKFELSFTKFPNSPYNSYSHSWEDVSKTIFESSHFGDELKKTSYFEDDIDAVVSGISDQTQKMMKIFEFAKSKMTWNSLYGMFSDEGVKKAYKEGTGNVGDINLMLTAMFRHAGLNANPVLVSTKNNGIPIFPTGDGFNYVISGVVIDGEVFLCDATNKNSEVNVLEKKLLNWQGRMIVDEATSAWVPLTPSKHAVNNTMLNAKISEDLSVQGSSKNQVNGHYAMEYRNTFQNLNEEATIKKLEENKGESELSNVSFENLKVLHEPITNSFDFELQDAIEDVSGKLYFSPLLFLAMTENPFKLEERKYPVDYGYPKKDRYIISIDIPEGYIVESMPENINFGLEQGMGGFKYLISNPEGKIQLMIDFSINSALIPADAYPGLKKFYQLLIDKENEKVVLSKA